MGHFAIRISLGLLVLCLVAQRSPIASAQSPPDAVQADRPWATGVSEPEQAIALEIYNAGNTAFLDSRYKEALESYRQALRHWDHPAIRFNMAVCLLALDHPVEARENFERSLAFGAPALGPNAFDQALHYCELLDHQLVHLQIECDERGAEVMLDGKFLFMGPGVADKYVLPGQHQVVANKIGFLTTSGELSLSAGALATYKIAPRVVPTPGLEGVRMAQPTRPENLSHGETAGTYAPTIYLPTIAIPRKSADDSSRRAKAVPGTTNTAPSPQAPPAPRGPSPNPLPVVPISRPPTPTMPVPGRSSSAWQPPLHRISPGSTTGTPYLPLSTPSGTPFQPGLGAASVSGGWHPAPSTGHASTGHTPTHPGYRPPASHSPSYQPAPTYHPPAIRIR